MHRFSHNAMACTFEILIAGHDPRYAQQCAWAAFEELDSLEQELSRFVPCSDIAQLNASTPGQPLRVGIGVMECLQLAEQVTRDTGGAFDVTVGSLLARQPDHSAPMTPDVGMQLLQIDPCGHTVARLSENVRVDLGAIGKGYALDRIAQVLRDWSVSSALVHGGQSSVLAIGTPPGREAWPVEIRDPLHQDRALGSVDLRDRAFSGSGLSLCPGHIVDPRTGRPAAGMHGAWALAGSAALSDALSTAFMLMSLEQVRQYCQDHPDVGAMVLPDTPEGAFLRSFGHCARLHPSLSSTSTSK